MKYLLFFLVISCAALNTRNFQMVQLGEPETQFKTVYRVRETLDVGNHRILSLDDGFVITDKEKVVKKIEPQHLHAYETKVSAMTTMPDHKFKYFIVPDPRVLDPQSILFAQVKSQVEAMLRLRGETIVSNIESADAVLKVGYAVTGWQTRTLSQGLMVLSQDTTYSRILMLSAAMKKGSEANIWETKVESSGPSNDLSVVVIGLVTASSEYINKSTTLPVEVPVESFNIMMNVIKNPSAFSPYLNWQQTEEHKMI